MGIYIVFVCMFSAYVCSFHIHRFAGWAGGQVHVSNSLDELQKIIPGLSTPPLMFICVSFGNTVITMQQLTEHLTKDQCSNSHKVISLIEVRKQSSHLLDIQNPCVALVFSTHPSIRSISIKCLLHASHSPSL